MLDSDVFWNHTLAYDGPLYDHFAARLLYALIKDHDALRRRRTTDEHSTHMRARMDGLF